MLESAGLTPRLIAGASMGAIVGLFRARADRFEVSQVPEIMSEVLENIDARARESRTITGVPTGFKKLDEITAGFQPEKQPRC